MFPSGWFIWWVLLKTLMTARGLEITGYDSDGVVCSQGLSECVMKDEILLLAENYGAEVQNLTAHIKLCSKTSRSCTLCLIIDMDLRVGDIADNVGHSGLDEEYDSDDTRNANGKQAASVTVCYKTPPSMPTCKRVEFNVNHTAFTRRNQAKMTLVITEPAGISFGSEVSVFKSQSPRLAQVAVVPSLSKVCSQELRECVDDCHVPELRTVIPQKLKYIELQFDGRNNSLPSLCIQYERNGRCERWTRRTVPVYSVARCMCFTAWYDHNIVRSQRCPFTNTEFAQRNVWRNVSVSLRQTDGNGAMLLWNISAPCRLEGEVWPCHKQTSCREIKGFRQQLENGTWKQNSKGLWEKLGGFEDVNLQLSPCVMVKVKGMEHELGPFCSHPDRWRWSPLVICVILLFFMIMLVFSILQNSVKKWAWSWHHGGFVKIAGEHHVVLLSPPDVDSGVSESVCRLGSLLCDQGLSVSVDQWSRNEQGTMGPLPWLHSQLLRLNRQGTRVVVILTHSALERTEEWAHQYKEVIKRKTQNRGQPQIWSPYSDLFTAALCLIQADKQLGRAARFLLATFDSTGSISDRSLPELLQGLPLLQLPSQTQALLTELSAGGPGRTSGGRAWTGWKWGGSDGWRAKTKVGPDQQKAPQCKCSGVGTHSEKKPLTHS